jgi:hypothetical protein
MSNLSPYHPDNARTTSARRSVRGFMYVVEDLGLMSPDTFNNIHYDMHAPHALVEKYLPAVRDRTIR